MSLESEFSGEEIIHIIPLGFEIDRAIKPFERYKPNKVYILSTLSTFGNKYTASMINEQKVYLQKVEGYLKEQGIAFETRDIDTFDTLAVAKYISNIIVEEQTKKNLVYVNISSAGRLTSVVATLSAMAHGAKAYYVIADSYASNPVEQQEHGISICNKLRIQIIDNLPLQIPNEIELNVLIKLCEVKDENQIKTKDGISMVAIEKSLGNKLTPGYERCAERSYPTMSRKDRINCHMKLKGILEKLTEQKYISTKKVGKERLSKINPTGVFIANISGKMVEKERSP